MVYRRADVDRACHALEAAFLLAQIPDAQQVHVKESGYRAAHLLVVIGASADRPSLRGSVVEIQIVTLAAHVFNELEHSAVYKQGDVRCASVVTGEVTALLHGTEAVDHLAQDIAFAEARSRRDQCLPPRSPIELAMAFECVLGRSVRGELAVVFDFAVMVGSPLVRDPGLDSSMLIELFTRGRAHLAQQADPGVDDATCILLALIDGHRGMFLRFAD